jgi:hypothetical protein
MLDNVTLEAARQQLALNAKMAGPGFLGLAGRPTYSASALVTPAISGLFNGDALAAMAEAGITTAVGDNTWPILLNPANPHHMLYTTEAANGYPSGPGTYAVAIMPRWATSIAFSASTMQEALDTYNSEQASPAARLPSFDALIAKEADRVVNDALLALRHDGHMFHQANLRTLGSGGSGGGSLLSMWADAALGRLSAVVDWPVRSLKLEELSKEYLRREARDACALEYRLTVDRARGAVTAVAVRSGAPAPGGNGTAAAPPAPPCAAPLMLRGAARLATALGEAAAESREWGVRTLSVAVPPGGAVVMNVSGGLPWGAAAPAAGGAAPAAAPVAAPAG